MPALDRLQGALTVWSMGLQRTPLRRSQLALTALVHNSCMLPLLPRKRRALRDAPLCHKHHGRLGSACLQSLLQPCWSGSATAWKALPSAHPPRHPYSGLNLVRRECGTGARARPSPLLCNASLQPYTAGTGTLASSSCVMHRRRAHLASMPSSSAGQHARIASSSQRTFAAARKAVDVGWCAGRLRHVRSVRGHLSGVFMVAVDPCGRYFVTGSDDAVAKIWCCRTAVLQASCCAHLVRAARSRLRRAVSAGQRALLQRPLCSAPGLGRSLCVLLRCLVGLRLAPVFGVIVSRTITEIIVHARDGGSCLPQH
jgi:hypothetical protein